MIEIINKKVNVVRKDLYEMFRENFPFIIRENNTAMNILSDPNNKVIEKRNEDGDLIGVSVINKNTIYMLCVNKEYRHKGIGTWLLNESENYILSKGYDKVIIGAGDSYLMPGIPMRSKPYTETLKEDRIYDDVTDDANDFFTKRGYAHSWNDCNCFVFCFILVLFFVYVILYYSDHGFHGFFPIINGPVFTVR